MDIGICYPMLMNTAQQRDNFLTWCEAVDNSPLSTLALGERIAYDAQDAMISLALAAGATRRCRLTTSVLALPTRNTGLIAKEAATLDILSGGRFSLGVGMSSRPQDFSTLALPYRGRADVFEKQLQDLKAIWRGEPSDAEGNVIGPAPLTDGGPELIVGAIRDPAFDRAGRLADGIMTWSFAPMPDMQRHWVGITQRARESAGRSGRPRVIAAMYFALGGDAESRLMGYLNEYYAYSPLISEWIQSITTYTPAAIKDAISAYTDAGVDEILFAAPDTDVDQVHRLADLIH